MKKVKRWMCDSCGAAHFAEVVEANHDKCLTCGGAGAVRTVEQDDAGVIHASDSD